ncbi:AcrR family transcriptional regulator [Pseudochelatococcus lubricantis]|uniref:AcrR family transcriptional regulator n=1 Tax=Pseudochelatococcus lubricantis TaxID=1538102 RepID=A0ABX0V374_9HYPH|nr:TetR/AcrR family transcriptional regulator [Pseudochelatococcus lubricantis]NIJ59397.1 AcrR family transcriptional regulator [Pseudochelatococcus lubricantis]
MTDRRPGPASTSVLPAHADAPPPGQRPEARAHEPERLEVQRTERRDLILRAAERCFTSFGFHRTTMQLVAKEAGMSQGNLYRYFPSKNAIVEGLVERDRDEARRRFDSVDPGAPFWDQFRKLGEDYFIGDAQCKAALCIEIWAEATRNPEIDAINRPIEQEIVARLVALLERAQVRGEIAADIDCAAAAQMIIVITSGLYVRSALRRDGDGTEQLERALEAVYGLLSGAPALRLSRSEASGGHCGPERPASTQEPSS